MLIIGINRLENNINQVNMSKFILGLGPKIKNEMFNFKRCMVKNMFEICMKDINMRHIIMKF